MRVRSHRLDKVASLIRDVLSDAIAHRLNDPRIVSMTSVIRVEVSADMLHARVFISVMGTKSQQKKTLDGLNHSVPFVQSLLAKRLTTRHCPRLKFIHDPSIKNAMETNRIIDAAISEQTGCESEGSASIDAGAGNDSGESR